MEKRILFKEHIFGGEREREGESALLKGRSIIYKLYINSSWGNGIFIALRTDWQTDERTDKVNNSATLQPKNFQINLCRTSMGEDMQQYLYESSDEEVNIIFYGGVSQGPHWG